MPFFQFPTSENSWKFDAVGLLAVVGEATMEHCGQTVTSSYLSLLPRLIPAPQALVRPKRVRILPTEEVAFVHIVGSEVTTKRYGFFANVLVPINELSNFYFLVLQLSRRGETELSPDQRTAVLNNRETFRAFQNRTIIPSILKISPMNIITVGSSMMTLGLISWSAAIRDGSAFIALILLAVTSTILCRAYLWKPKTQPLGFQLEPFKMVHVVVLGLQGAVVIFKCSEDIAPELFQSSANIVDYEVGGATSQLLVVLSTVFLMSGIVMMGNATWTMQLALGVSYAALHVVYGIWVLTRRTSHWDFSKLGLKDITPRDGHYSSDDERSAEMHPCLTRTLWYAIREIKSTSWAQTSGYVQRTTSWNNWLRLAEENALSGNRGWNAVETREKIDRFVD